MGRFSIDLLAFDISRERKVIIENQLERTDHDYLGKLITYASGIEAGVLIWISPQFLDEHRAAVDWLNRTTADGIDVFAIQLEALQIDESRPAPNFKVLSSPNWWSKTAGAVARQSSEASEAGRFFVNYFTEFAQAAKVAGFVRIATPAPQHWIVVERLYRNVHIAVAFSRLNFVVGLYLDLASAEENAVIYHWLKDREGSIAAKLGPELHWNYAEGRKRQQVWTALPDIARDDPQALERATNWGVETLVRFRDVFTPLIREAAQALSLT